MIFVKRETVINNWVVVMIYMFRRNIDVPDRQVSGIIFPQYFIGSKATSTKRGYQSIVSPDKLGVLTIHQKF